MTHIEWDEYRCNHMGWKKSPLPSKQLLPVWLLGHNTGRTRPLRPLRVHKLPQQDGGFGITRTVSSLTCR